MPGPGYRLSLVRAFLFFCRKREGNSPILVCYHAHRWTKRVEDFVMILVRNFLTELLAIFLTVFLTMNVSDDVSNVSEDCSDDCFDDVLMIILIKS